MEIAQEKVAVHAPATPLQKFWLAITATDEETLCQCPEQDWSTVQAVGQLMAGTWLYQFGLFNLITHRLFAPPGVVRADLLAASAFLATFILLIDSFMIMRSGWHLAGLAELRRGGLALLESNSACVKAGFFLAIRIVLSIGIAQLTAIFVSILIFAHDISARIEAKYLAGNGPLIAKATMIVDADIKRAADAVTTFTASRDALAGQVTAIRQGQIDPLANDPQVRQAQEELTQAIARKNKAEDDVRAAEQFATNERGGIRGANSNSGVAGNGPRARAATEQLANARVHATELTRALESARNRVDALRKQRSNSISSPSGDKGDGQLAAFESASAAAENQLQKATAQLRQLTEERDAAIREIVEHSPGHVMADDGFLSQIIILGQIADSDRKLALVIILIDVVSFGFELAAVLAKVTSWIPMTYVALLARDAYLTAVRIADGMMEELDRISKKGPVAETKSGASDESAKSNAAPKNGSIFGENPFASTMGEAAPPKRPRGRPRKTPLN